jgi:putative ABC transport system substrate-binding protein
MIGRREFITLLGGAAAWPLAARAGQPAMPVIGVLSGLQVPVHLIAAFRQGLGEVGYVEGQNVTFASEGGGDHDRFRRIADELARRQVAVIFATGGTAAALAASQRRRVLRLSLSSHWRW